MPYTLICSCTPMCQIVLDPVLTRVRSSSADVIRPSSPPPPPVTAGHIAAVAAKASLSLAPPHPPTSSCASSPGVCANIESRDNHYHLLWRGRYRSNETPSTTTKPTVKADTATTTTTGGGGSGGGGRNPNTESVVVAPSAVAAENALESPTTKIESATTTDTTTTTDSTQVTNTLTISEHMKGGSKRSADARETLSVDRENKRDVAFTDGGEARLWHPGYENAVRRALELSKHREMNS